MQSFHGPLGEHRIGGFSRNFDHPQEEKRSLDFAFLSHMSTLPAKELGDKKMATHAQHFSKIEIIIKINLANVIAK